MSFASLCGFTYAYPVLFLSKCYRKEQQRLVLAVWKSYRKEVLALLLCNRKEVLAVSRTQAQEELLLADAKRSSCACIIFGLYCKSKFIIWNNKEITTESKSILWTFIFSSFWEKNLFCSRLSRRKQKFLSLNDLIQVKINITFNSVFSIFLTYCRNSKLLE